VRARIGSWGLVHVSGPRSARAYGVVARGMDRGGRRAGLEGQGRPPTRDGGRGVVPRRWAGAALCRQCAREELGAARANAAHCPSRGAMSGRALSPGYGGGGASPPRSGGGSGGRRGVGVGWPRPPPGGGRGRGARRRRADRAAGWVGPHRPPSGRWPCPGGPGRGARHPPWRPPPAHYRRRRRRGHPLTRAPAPSRFTAFPPCLLTGPTPYGPAFAPSSGSPRS
jgi:hypothetical protein